MRSTATFCTLFLTGLLAHGQYWTQLAPYPVAVSGAYGFNMNGRLFVGGGISSYDPLVGHSGFYEYLPDSDQWVARATPPFGALYRAGTDQWSGHVVGGSQVDTAFHPTNDHWLYDAVNDAWTQKASMPGLGREGLTVMSKGPFPYGYFYAGLGGEPTMNDWHQYISALDQWVVDTSMSGSGRTGALSFPLTNGLGFVGGGMPSLSDMANTIFADGYEWSEDYHVWLPASLPYSVLDERPRAFAACYSYCSSTSSWALQVAFGGLGLEADTPTVLNDGVAVNGTGFPVQLGLLPFGPLAEAVSLYQPFQPSYNTLYMGTGTTSLIPGTWKPATFSNTWWRYTAGGLGLGIGEYTSTYITWRSDGEQLHVQWPAGTGAVELDVLDALGRTAKTPIRAAGSSGQAEIDMSGLSAGTYLLRWRSDERTEVIRFVQP